ncbi:hypothetical protein NDU88_004481 [Pleurodeles waltl]|uniref:Basic proline-rich protein-like n=1 Tax=Pleurodeles waltl TaxID=8319 RepID=A0AAV7RFU7_PLEWA|nr:hypothetical protein NDU88_004481 [Pleurodeles waltl]
MVQGDSTLSRPTKDSQNSSCAALGVVSPVVGFRGLPGSKHQSSGCAFTRGAHPKRTPHRTAPGGPPPPCLSAVRSPSVREHQAPPPKQEADSPPAGAPTRRSGLHPSFRAGPHSRPAPGAVYRSVRGRGRNPAATHVGPGPHRGARVRRRPPPGPRPHSSRPGSVGRSPAMLQHGEPPGTARLGPARRPGATSPQLRAAPVTRGSLQGGETAPPRFPCPQQSSHSTLGTGPPASARPGTDLKSAPPEPIS